MSVLERKLFRELKSSTGLLLAITSIMAVGVSGYVALGSAYRNLTSAQRLYYSQCRMADFSIELKKAPLSEVQQLVTLPGVVELRPRIQFYAAVDIERKVQPVNGLVLSLPDRQEHVIDDIVLRQGGYFTDRRDNEVIVNEAFARKHGLFPGQWIHLLLNNRRQELFIVGTAISSEFVYLVGPGAIVPDPEHFGVFYLKRSYAEEVFDFQGACNNVLGRLAPTERARPQETLRRAENMLSDYGVFTSTPLRDQASNRFLSNEIEGLNSFGKVMPTIFLAVAAMILNMLITRLTEQQRVVVGTLKALGYSNLEVFLHFLQFGMAVGLAGGFVGCFLGYWMAEGMTIIYRRFFEFPNLVNGFYLDIYLVGLLLSLACGVVGTLNGARNVLRLDPAEAMRPKPPTQGGAIWLEHFTGLWKKLSFGWRMTLRNIVRHRLRTTASMFAAAMGASVLVNGLMMERSTSFLIDFQFHKIQRSDIDLAFKDDHGREALLECRSLPGVDYAEPLLDVACTFTNGPYSRKGGITGLIPNARLTVPRDAEVRPMRIAPFGLTMTRKMAQLMHLERGDRVTIRPVKGERREVTAPIVEITDSFLGLAVYADIDYLSSLVDEEFAMNGAQLSVSPDTATRDTLYRELKQMPGIQAVTARADSIRSVMDTLIKNQRVFIMLLVIFAGVIFFGAVLNASLISLAERQREVATLRVLGYTEWQIGALFLRESGLTNLFGTLLGLPLGYWLSVVVAKAYDTDWFRIPVVSPGPSWVAAIGLGMLFGLAAHAFVQWAIIKMDWLEALKIKE